MATITASCVAILLPENDREVLLRSAYITGAHVASEEQESHKLSVILLRRILLNDRYDVALFIQTLYIFSKPSLANGQHKGSSTLVADVLRYIKESVDPLVDTANPSHMYLSAEDLLMLSHIYLAYGMLQKCLLTTQFLSTATSSSGKVLHVSNICIIVQEWSVLKALDDNTAADICMKSLCPLLATALRNLQDSKSVQRSEIQCLGNVYCSQKYIVYAYLFCALYLQRQDDDTAFEEVVGEAHQYLTGRESSHKSATLRRELSSRKRQDQNDRGARRSIENITNSLLQRKSLFSTKDEEQLRILTEQLDEERELYLKWFEDSALWLEIATDFQDSPYIILCECSYWECYSRAEVPSDKVLIRLVDSMERRNAGDSYICKILIDAYAIERYCGYCRLKIIEYEGKLIMKNGARYSPAIIHENHLFINLQRFIRKVQYKKIKDAKKIEIFKAQKIKRSKFIATRDIAMKMFVNIGHKYFEGLFWRWNNFLQERKELRYYSSIKIQTKMRTYLWWKNHKLRKKRIAASNSLYLAASELHFNFTRSCYIQIWSELTDRRRKNRAQEVVYMFLKSVKHLKKHVKAKAIILKIIEGRKIGLKIEFLSYWLGRHQRYERTVYRFLIRRWIRAMLNKGTQQTILSECFQIF